MIQTIAQTNNLQQATRFQYLITIKPLGLLYGSAGRFLSPDNLVGISGNSFPPSAATLSGIFAANCDEEQLSSLQLAGAFWAKDSNLRDFYVPTPMNCLVKDGTITNLLSWHQEKKQWLSAIPRRQQQGESNEDYAKDKYKPKNDKYQKGTWIELSDWNKLKSPETEVYAEDYKGFPKVVTETPWKFLPHLHPRLMEDERRVDTENPDKGSLFLENSVQMTPDVSLIYLSNLEIEAGWYRFGGEGHLVEINSIPFDETLSELFQQDVGKTFATITPAIWGSNRLSCREPRARKSDRSAWYPDYPSDRIKPILTQRPTPMRYRLGDHPDGQQPEQPKRLSRGRYAVPPGSVYVVDKPLPNWQSWSDDWFPHEGYSFKRWGCGLALPLEIGS